jgi:type II secretory pathway pseudopilin PulG
LVELLTVIAIIGILAAILIPTVGKVRESAFVAKTTSNLRQLYNGNRLHAADYKGLYVPAQALTLDGNGAKPAQWYNSPIFGRYIHNEKLNGWNDREVVLQTAKPDPNGNKGPSLALSIGNSAFPKNFSFRAIEVDDKFPHMVMFADSTNWWISGESTRTVAETWTDEALGKTGAMAFRYGSKATAVLASGVVVRLTKVDATSAENFAKYFPSTGNSATRLQANEPPY